MASRDGRAWLHAAWETAGWLAAAAEESERGKAWRPDPTDSTPAFPSLYSGTAGVVLFYLEMYSATGDPSCLGEACAGAEHLADALPDSIEGQDQAGLYTGVAGIGFVLEEVHQATGRRDFRDSALRCVDLLVRSAKRRDGGAAWGPVTDIVSGNAGIGLFLLYAAKQMEHGTAGELAVLAGRQLARKGIPERGGLKWAMDPSYPRLMPNFSHGTAGICFFLSRLHQATGEAEFLRSALDGARYLRKSAEGTGLVFHHEPGGEDLFYLGWCHGPPGTAMLYYLLYEITGEAEWLDSAHTAAEAVMQSGIPEQRTPGFWNNVGRCCGNAGVAAFFLFLHEKTGRGDYLDFSERLTADLLARGTSGEEGMMWIHAEHRVMPDRLSAQTGLMQGAAGIGLWLLRLDGFARGREPAFILPDSIF